MDQEKQIASLVEEGNRQLRGLNNDILIATHVLKETKTEIRMLRQDKLTAESDIEGIRAAFAIEETIILARLEGLNTEARSLEIRTVQIV